MELTRNCADRSCRAYLEVLDDTPPSFLGTVSSLVGSLRLGGRSQPTRPAPPTLSPNPPSSTTSDSGSISPTTTTAPSKITPVSAPPVSSSEPFRALPPSQSCILLPLYDLLHSNKTFLALLLAPDASFLPTFLSFASYLFAHASAGPRSGAYSRLGLVTLLVLVEEGGRGMCHEERTVQVRFCRQVRHYLARAKKSLLTVFWTHRSGCRRYHPRQTCRDRRSASSSIAASFSCGTTFRRSSMWTRTCETVIQPSDRFKRLTSAFCFARVALKLVHRILITLQAARVRIGVPISCFLSL